MGTAMGLKIWAAGLSAAVIAVAFASAAAEAAPAKRTIAKQTRPAVTRQVAVNRARTRVIVQPRSFLDAGT